MKSREEQLYKFRKVLNTPDGMELMEELRKAWYNPQQLDPHSTQATAYNLGLLDAYRVLESFMNGDNIDVSSNDK